MAALFVEVLMVAVAAYAASLRGALSPHSAAMSSGNGPGYDALGAGPPEEADAVGFAGSRLSPIGTTVLLGAG
jgi:hypothetical protein